METCPTIIIQRRLFLCVCFLLLCVLYALSRQRRWIHSTAVEPNSEMSVVNLLKSVALQSISESAGRLSLSSDTAALKNTTRKPSSVRVQTLQTTTEKTDLEVQSGMSKQAVPPTLKVMGWEGATGNKLYSPEGQGHVLYNLTIVSAYFDLGTFAKGSTDNRRGRRDYETWFQKLAMMHIPLVFYTDSDSFAQLVVRLREGELSGLTKVILVSRDKLWSFQLRDKVAKIYAQSSYPKHLPNTVIPEYSCAMHAKFEVLNNTMQMGYFPSRHYAWIDVGCFRDLQIKNNEIVSFVPPPDLQPQRIMYSQVFDPSFSTSPSRIFLENIVWVGGASFIGRAEVVLEFTEQYRRATVLFLEERNLSNSDQQVIYSMFTDDGRQLVKPTVELQLIRKGWFGVGYQCLKREAAPQNNTKRGKSQPNTGNMWLGPCAGIPPPPPTPLAES